MDSIDIETVSIQLGEDGVIVAREKESERHTPATTHRALDALAEVAGGRRRPMLWDVRRLSVGGPEARAIFVQRMPESLSALAVLVDQQIDEELQGALEAFTPIIESLMMPIRVFYDEDAALGWLRSVVISE